jgi:phosphoribosylformimino-5-aminoimidazole carboxamide ribotide isomerase
MNIYPAIDLKSGECVRLLKGSYAEVTIYAKDPIAQAKLFSSQGASILHVVDLDGAREGKSQNLSIISKIAGIPGLSIQVGGGLRTGIQIKTIFDLGVSRIILGSMAVSNPKLVKEWINEWGSERIVLALDVRFNDKNIPLLALQGWEIQSTQSLWELLDDYQNTPLKHVLCTDINRDGTLDGPNFSLYRECVTRYPTLQFQASGGISSLDDLSLLNKIPVSAAIVGKAIYENSFSLSEALNGVSSC